MDQLRGGGEGSWSMIPSIPTHSNPTTPPPNTNQDHLFLPPQQQQQESLASHFHLSNLLENLADAIENGSRDQHFDTLVTELSGQFINCQQLLDDIFGSITSKSATVEGEKRKVEECDQLINQRRDLIAKYKNSAE